MVRRLPSGRERESLSRFLHGLRVLAGRGQRRRRLGGGDERRSPSRPLRIEAHGRRPNEPQLSRGEYRRDRRKPAGEGIPVRKSAQQRIERRWLGESEGSRWPRYLLRHRAGRGQAHRVCCRGLACRKSHHPPAPRPCREGGRVEVLPDRCWAVGRARRWRSGQDDNASSLQTARLRQRKRELYRSSPRAGLGTETVKSIDVRTIS
jgi:hypothetical protein